MRIHRGFDMGLPACALTIGNFDGVHRGHQAMLALLTNEARHRELPACVLTFEPHPRDYFAGLSGRPEQAPARISTLRDKLVELRRCGVDHVVVARFDQAFASQAPQAFIDVVLRRALRARYVLVGDDFSFGARRAGNYAMLDAAGSAHGFDVARMLSYEVHGLRVSSSAVRDALAAGDMPRAQALLGRPYSISGHVLHGRKLGRDLGYRTLNLSFPHARPATHGVFAVKVRGLTDRPLPAVASLGVRPTVEQGGAVLLEVHCLQWPSTLGPEGGYGRCVQVELLHKLRDEKRYDTLADLQAAIAQDSQQAQHWLARQA